MHIKNASLAYMIVAALSIAPQLGAAEPTYTFKVIDYPGAAGTNGTGINDAGQIVGQYYLPGDSRTHAFLLDDGVFTTIDYPGAAHTDPMAINAGSEIVGFYTSGCYNGFGCRYPFHYKAGVFTQLPEVPGAYPGTTEATGINASGQIVGSFMVGYYESARGYTLDRQAGTSTVVTVPGATFNNARSGNDLGDIVGGYEWVAGSGQQRGYLRHQGAFTSIDLPGATCTDPWGINNSGQIVGRDCSNGGVPGGLFLFKDGNYTVLQVPNAAVILWYQKINNVGQIVGSYRDAQGVDHGFVATPEIQYRVTHLYDSSKAVRSGATIPIKIQVLDQDAKNVSSPSLVVHATKVVLTSNSASQDVQDAGNSNPDDDFRYDPTLGGSGGYIFNLKTTGLSTGSYNLTFTIGDSATVMTAPFQVR